MNAETTRSLLSRLPQTLNSQLHHALLAALAASIVRWTGDSRVLVDVEGHGREQLSDLRDPGNTVGWFTTVYPVWLNVAPDAGPGELLGRVREELRAVPSGGLPFGVMREHGPAAIQRQLRSLPQPEICFNYLGQQGDRFSGCRRLCAPTVPSSYNPGRSPRCPRAYLLEVNALVTSAGELRTNWTYSSALHDTDTINMITASYVEALEAMARYAEDPDGITATPSDFPLAELDSEGLADLSRLINEADKLPNDSPSD